MSYLSLISCTDRDVIWVATRIRSAYSSVSKRETSFSRIALDSVMDINDSSIRFSILILADREESGVFRATRFDHTIGRRSAFGTPADQSQARLNSSVYGFCPYTTTDPL